MDELFEHCDAVVCKPLRFERTVEKQYDVCHNIDDLKILEGIIKEKFPEYESSFQEIMHNNIIFPCNMFIMKREDFIEYVDFVKGALDEFVKVIGTDIEKRIEDNKDKYLKDFSPNDEVWYQYRIGGYLGERLTSVFILKKFERVKAYKMIITEQKYK
jgi:hypothetical protein